jgi:predicted transcriptional regulator
MALVAKDVMRSGVLSVPPDMELGALGDFLVSNRITGAAVTESGRLVGVVSRSDIVRVGSLGTALVGFVADELAGGEMRTETGTASTSVPADVRDSLVGHRVRDVMATSPVTVTPDTPVAKVAAMLHERHIHRVFVTDGGAPVGVISSLDLVQLIADGRLRDA